MTNSKRKGSAGEREWARFLTTNGYDARRGQQYAGNPESPDVLCPDLAHMHFEVKRVQRLNLTDAMDQATRDAGDKTPILAHRKNHCRWMVTMYADDWIELVREAV